MCKNQCTSDSVISIYVSKYICSTLSEQTLYLKEGFLLFLACILS